MLIKRFKLLKFFSIISILFFIIFASIKITLNFKPLYYFDINYLNLEKNTNLYKDDIIESYDYIIYYVNNPTKSEFIIPNFSSSIDGKVHFKEVQNLVSKLNYALLIAFFLTLISLYNCYRLKNFSIFNTAANSLFFISFIVVILSSINFNKSFTIFHNIIFNNNYWIFDPEKDPIIKILPEEFFMHCSIMVIILIWIICVFIKILQFKKNG